MANDLSIHDLLCQVHAGSQEAAAELVRLYEPAVRRVVQQRLFDAQFDSLLDVEAICRSVSQRFLLHAIWDRQHIATPERLARLLARLIRNSLASLAHTHRARHCDHRRRVAAANATEWLSEDRNPSPA